MVVINIILLILLIILILGVGHFLADVWSCIKILQDRISFDTEKTRSLELRIKKLEEEANE